MKDDTFEKEKCLTTSVLSLSESGYKLPPLLILKDKVEKKEKDSIILNLLKIFCEKTRKCLLFI